MTNDASPWLPETGNPNLSVTAGCHRRAGSGRERSVCRRTCLTRTEPSPCRSSSRWRAVGSPAGLGQEGTTDVVGGGQPHHGAGEPVRAQGVRAGLDEARAVPVPGVARVDGAARRPRRPRPGRRRGRRRGQVTAKPRTVLRSSATSTRLRASLGLVRDACQAARRGPTGSIALEHLLGQQPVVLLAPGAHLHVGDAVGVLGPGDADRDVGGGAAVGAHGADPAGRPAECYTFGSRVCVPTVTILW